MSRSTHAPLAAVLLAATSLVGTPLPAAAQEVPATADRWNRAALEWVALLRAGDFDAAAARVDPDVPAGAMDADRLGALWGQLEGQLGPLRTVAPGAVSESGPYHLVDLPASFERQELVLRVVLTDDLAVSGFNLQPAAAPPYEPPPYVDTTAFREVEVTVGEAPWELPGTLTLPEGPGPFAAVVLVHGSGPNDRDETVGGNRPFRDLAWGLATRDVAVLRYDKRTRVHGARMTGPVGLDDEVIDDAVAALALARARPEVDAERVFVLGHSLGGLVAPEIARRDGRVAGVVVAAGPARPFGEVILEQLEYIASLREDGGGAAVDSAIAHVRRFAEGQSQPGDSILGGPVAYWEEVAAVQPVATARQLEVPFLVLQGGRDYQVTEADLALWREGLAGRDDVRIELYPTLNHLFGPGEGMATPSEYVGEVKHVAPEVIGDVAAWIGEVGG